MILSNKYRSALNKINVTPEMEKRIFENISNQKETIRQDNVKKYSFHNWFKPIGIVAACCIIIVSLAVVYPSIMNNNQKAPEFQSLNPIVNAKGIKELKKDVPFELITPNELPLGYKFDNASIIAGDLAQIIYTNGNDTIQYRMAKGTDDISGDYNIYKTLKVAKVGTMKVTLKGNKTVVKLATWTNNNNTFSISSSSGLQKEVILSIIESLK
jgi:hypothetical protein